MTNAEAATHFATLPPDQDAEILLCEPDTGSAEVLDLKHQRPEILEDIENDFLGPETKNLLLVWRKW